jgi:hypothetical protein
MIEAMACGTPVIAFRRGSVPEIVEEGVSGFVVDTIDEAVTAVGRITRLDRALVRAEFERRFTAERMAHDYLDIYRKLSARSGSAQLAILNEGRQERHGERSSRSGTVDNHDDPQIPPLNVACTKEEKTPISMPLVTTN